MRKGELYWAPWHTGEWYRVRLTAGVHVGAGKFRTVQVLWLEGPLQNHHATLPTAGLLRERPEY